MTVINTNVAATVTANAMKTNARAMETSMERLSTGKRINSASDDAAGLGIETRMTSQVRGLQQASRGATDGIAMLQTADGAAAEISDMLQRMRELAVQSRLGTMSADDITNIDQEYVALALEIDRVATDTTFNNKAIIGANAGAIKISVGADESDIVTFTTKSLELDTTAVYGADLDAAMAAGGADDVDVDGTIAKLDAAIKGVATERAAYGATINRLEFAIDTINTTVLNTQAARSQIVDADYAAETTELARTQIISQASTAMLSQANQQAQSVLALLK
jgi:flagellin